jgi:hypothetical protein
MVLDKMEIAANIDLEVLPRQLTLEGVGAEVSLARLRGVWGLALHDTHPEAYAAVFQGMRPDGRQCPAYVMTDLGRDACERRVLQWTLLGAKALSHDAALCAAWGTAGGDAYGLGPRGHRAPFRVAEWRVRGPDGAALPEGFTSAGWNLRHARWPVPSDPATTPCRVSFPGGVHLRRNGCVLTVVDWAEVVRAALLRVYGWLDPSGDTHADLARREPAILQDAEERRATLNLNSRETREHYSGAQDKTYAYKVLHGAIDLPEGPGPAWPLLLAGQWLSIGHHITQGLGAVVVQALPTPKAATVR